MQADDSAADKQADVKSKEKLNLRKLPSPFLIINVWLFATQVYNLFTKKDISAWIENGAQFSEAPLKELGLILFFGGFALSELLKTLGAYKSDFYGNLEGFDVNSLSSQAADWALAGIVPTRSEDEKYEVATFAGGCFWGTELHFQRIPGVVATCVGYTQGDMERPSYSQVCSGVSGHTEGIQLLYDPKVISYDKLCDKLLSTVDSTALNRVGNDMGTQYRHGIYPHTPAQTAAADAAIKREQKKRGSNKVVTEVFPAAIFWPAEKYHQRYLQKGGQSAEKNAAEPVRCYG